MAKLPKKPKPGDLERMFEELVGAPMDEWPDPDASEEADLDPMSDLIDLFVEAGAMIASPSILQPADIFLDTAGEDLRRRLFVTAGIDGREMCLRPEFTIPVSLEYLSDGRAGRTQAYAYMGPVFRQRPGELGEFNQAGIERFGEADRTRADAEILKLAIDAVELFGLLDGEVLMGDEALFSAVMDALQLPAALRRRLRAVFGDRAKLEATITALTQENGGDLATHASFIGALAGANHEAARAVVEDLLAIAGITSVGNRTAHEIAERFLEQASLKAEGGLSAEKAALLREFLDIGGNPAEAIGELRAFAGQHQLDIAAAIAAFEARIDALSDLGIDVGSIQFETDFGRQLDYYTGLVFEIRDPERVDGKPVIGGGRYDGLLARLGAETPVPAVGFSMWLDRLELDLDIDEDQAGRQ